MEWRALRATLRPRKIKILQRIGAAFRIFTQNYDFPTDLATVVQQELRTIQLALVNLKAFLMNGQHNDAEQAAKHIESACERIRDAAKPYAYRDPSTLNTTR